EGFYPHPPHQRSDMPAADLAPLGGQQASQHTRAGEGVLQVQPVEASHDREVGCRHRPRQVVNAAPADVENLRLLGYRQIVGAVDHRFALSNPALLSAPSKKSFSSVSSPILACSVFTSTTGSADHGCAAFELRLPLGDLIRVHVELFCELGKRSIAFDRSKGYFRFEGRCVIPAGALLHSLS